MAYTTIDDPTAYFQVKLYTGNNSTNAQTLDSDTNMQPDMIWFKRRDSAAYPSLIDDVRGVTKRLAPSETDAEGTVSDALSSFDSDGFTLGDDDDNYINYNTATYVAWCWKESATAGFDIVSYTGNATNRTISHSLSAVPHMMIIKNRATTADWLVYHRYEGHSHYLLLSETNGLGTESGVTKEWNSTDPTSSVFSVGTSAATNGNTNATIAYLFTSIQGFSKFGSYTGNGNADGTFIYTGFKPAWFMIKRTTAGYNWTIKDNKRSTYNEATTELYADATDGDENSGGAIDFLSNGVKIRNSSGTWNGSGVAYVYMAFAEAPFVNSNGVPNNAR